MNLGRLLLLLLMLFTVFVLMLSAIHPQRNTLSNNLFRFMLVHVSPFLDSTKKA